MTTTEYFVPDTAPPRATAEGIPDIMISTRWEAAKWCHEFDHVLSVFTPPPDDPNCLEFGHRDHTVIKFNDRVKAKDGAPTRSQVQQILDWATWRTGSMLIHCKAGQSRSVASAIAINALKGYDEPEAFRLAEEHYRPLSKIAEGRPFIPNIRVLSHADYILGTKLVDYATYHDMELGGFGTGPDW